MARSKKQLERLGLLAQLQRRKVETASAYYSSTYETHRQALEKLAGLEDYFENGPVVGKGTVYSVSLVEAGVFAQRLRGAIAAQKSACQQLKNQCEAARLALAQAEQRRAGFDKAQTMAARRLQIDAERRQQRELEDNLTARYSHVL